MNIVTEKNLNEQNILSLDVASHHTGFAIYSSGEIIISGTWHLDYTNWRSELYNHIQNAIETYQITCIIAEDIFNSVQKKATKQEKAIKQNIFRVLSECQCIISLIGEMNEIPVFRISPLEVKKAFLNIFNLWKYSREELKEKTIQKVLRYGYKLESNKADDEADAISFLIVKLEDNIIHPVQRCLINH